MQVRQRARRVGEQALHVGDARDEALLSQLGEALAFDALHDEDERAVFLEVLDVAREQIVLERSQRRRFALRELDVLPRLRLADPEALDRDEPTFAFVDGFEGLALCAFFPATDAAPWPGARSGRRGARSPTSRPE